MTTQTTHKTQSLENDPKTKCWTSHCSLSRIFGRQFVKSNPEPGHDTRLMNYTQLSYGPELGWRYQRASWNNRHESGASRYCGIVQHCMLRGVKTSTWSPQLLFVRHTHNNLLSIPTSTNHIQSNVAFYLQGVLEQEEAVLQKWSNWNFVKTNANIFCSTTCQEMSDSNTKYWWLSISSRKRLVSPVLWNCSEFLKLRRADPVSMSIPERTDGWP